MNSNLKEANEMFFIGIMGIGNKEKIILEIPNINCKACGSLGQYTVMKSYHYFHIFFIPLWKWKIEYYVKERTCQTIFRLDPEVGESIEKGVRSEIMPGDMEELHPARRCESCGGVLEEKFVYCPYCRKEQKNGAS